MAVPFLLALSSLVLGWMLARRVLSEPDPLLAAGLAVLLASSAIVGFANWIERSSLGALGLVFLLLAALCLLLPRPGPTPSWPARPTLLVLGAGALAVIFYTLYAQLYQLDTDNWIHEPLIAHYMRGVFPPVHPFFPEVSMNGHYGRDLLMASLTPDGFDPLSTVWLLNPVLALAGYFTLFGTLRRFGCHPWAAVLGTLMAYFGICVGFRVGLVDSFDGNNGVVYALAIGLFYLMFRVLELDQQPTSLPACLVAGATLGTYQLVYESHFGLLLLTALVLALWKVRRPKVWGGIVLTLVIALALAFTEGGPFTDLARRGTHQENDVKQQNVAQHVSITVPKQHFMQVLVTTADYQRLSVAYKSGPFRGLAPNISGDGYMYIFEPRFLYAHWLPLYLCPFTLWWLWKKRSAAGLAFWIFGFWAYLVPALIDFGPIYEWEYFRWEFAAGFGFATALGIALGDVLVKPRQGFAKESTEHGWRFSVPRDSWAMLLAVAVLIAALLPGEKLLNDAVIDMQKKPKPPLLTGWWRVARPEFGLEKVDLKAMAWLGPQVLPGEKVLSNLGDESPLGLWPDSVLATRTGAHPTGRGKPPRDQRVHAHPNYYRSPWAKLFFESGRIDVLYFENVKWLYLDLDKFKPLEALTGNPDVRPGPLFEDSEGNRRQVFELRFESWQEWRSQTPFRHQIEGWQPSENLRPGSTYALELTVANPHPHPARLGWVRSRLLDESEQAVTELYFLIGRNPLPSPGGDIQTVYYATPLEEGTYTLVLDFPHTESGEPYVLESRPLVVDFFRRLSQLSARFDLPEKVEPKKILEVPVHLSGPQLESLDELQLEVRLRRQGGDVVWELDGLSQPLDLRLEPGREQQESLSLVSPWEPGVYLVELTLRHRQTQKTLPLGGEPGVLRVDGR